jgi:trehalose 6-phosphate synthase/phosphatase
MTLLIASNRLPITLSTTKETFAAKASSGGLATGLRTFLDHRLNKNGGASNHIWIGWPGATIGKNLKENVKSFLSLEHQCFPVFLTEKDIEKFYFGFCNRTIWPIFHSFPSYAAYDEHHWEHYRRVSRAYAEKVVEKAKRPLHWKGERLHWRRPWRSSLPMMKPREFPDRTGNFNDKRKCLRAT